MEHPGQALQLATRVARRDEVLDLDVHQLADLDRVDPTLIYVVDRGAFHPEEFAYKGVEHCHRSSRLPPEHGSEPLRLFGRGRGVHDDTDAPIAIGHHPRSVREDDHRLPAHVDAVDLALPDVEHEHDPATVLVSR